MTLDSFSAGVNTSFSSELNNNFTVTGRLLSIETSTTPNISLSTASSSSSTLTTLTIPGSTLTNSDYLEIAVNGTFYAFVSNGTSKSGTSSMAIAVEDATSSTTLQASATVVSAGESGEGATGNRDRAHTFNIWHAVTAGNRTNGMSIEITLTGTTGNHSSGTAAYTNRAIYAIGHASS